MVRIKNALIDGIDVSMYAKPEFDEFQMYEIFEGLERGLNVEIYAYPHYHHKQMNAIRYGLELGLEKDAGKFADYMLPHREIFQIIYDLEEENKRN